MNKLQREDSIGASELSLQFFIWSYSFSEFILVDVASIAIACVWSAGWWCRRRCIFFLLVHLNRFSKITYKTSSANCSTRKIMRIEHYPSMLLVWSPYNKVSTSVLVIDSHQVAEVGSSAIIIVLGFRNHSRLLLCVKCAVLLTLRKGIHADICSLDAVIAQSIFIMYMLLRSRRLWCASSQ